MLSRVLPVAVAAAALALIPSTASATPEPAPVENIFAAGYNANVEVLLPDGRHASAWIGEYRGASQYGWERELSLRVWSEYPCYGTWTCRSGEASALVTLTDEQVDFSRDLGEASATDVDVTLRSWTWDPTTGHYTSTEEPVTVSLLFTGIGDVNRSTDRGDLCGDGGRECQSIRMGADREAIGTVTLDEHIASGPGSLSYVQGVDAAAPKFEDGVYN
jgi:hypothetical protein